MRADVEIFVVSPNMEIKLLWRTFEKATVVLARLDKQVFDLHVDIRRVMVVLGDWNSIFLIVDNVVALDEAIQDDYTHLVISDMVGIVLNKQSMNKLTL